MDTPDFGWQAFGGKVSVKAGWVRVQPQDSFRKRVYLAPVGLFLTLDAGTFEAVEFHPGSKEVRVVLSPASGAATVAQLRIESPAKGARGYEVIGEFVKDARGVTIPLSVSSSAVVLRSQRHA